MRRSLRNWCTALTLASSGGGAACSSPLEPVAIGWGEVRTLSDHREMDLGFQAPDGTILAGTLFLPLQQGEYPALVFHFGSTEWTRMTWEQGGPVFWVENGFAAFSYDKRGVGASEGDCCPWTEPDYFVLLGNDVLAATSTVRQHPEIRSDLVGAWGFSQGGWVVPVAAALGEGEVAFTIIGSGPVVTLQEELLYSELTGESACQRSELSANEIEQRLDEQGPGGFDPEPYLEAMDVPGLWIFGGLDLSVPVDRSVRNLERIRDDFGKDFTSVVIPDLNHSWVRDGTVCQQEGPGGIDGHVTYDWLAERFQLR